MTADGNSETDFHSRISKANLTFASFRNIWKTRKIGLKIKIHVLKTILLSTLRYGAESQKITKTVGQKLEVFQNRSIHRIVNIFWPNIITNEAR